MEIDNLNYVNQTISIESNQAYEWIVEWTPTRLGIMNDCLRGRSEFNKNNSYRILRIQFRF